MISQFIREYGGVIWTDHALERLKRRHISQSDALSVIKNPDKTYPGKKENSVKFIRNIKDRQIHVVGTLDERKQWIIMSVWVRGEEDPAFWLTRLIRYLWKAIVGR